MAALHATAGEMCLEHAEEIMNGKTSRHAIVWMCLLAMGLVLLVSTSAMACPTCKDSIEQNSLQQNMARGYFWSIVFMMSMPFLLLGSFSLYMWMEIRKARRLKAAGVKREAGESELANNAGAMPSPGG